MERKKRIIWHRILVFFLMLSVFLGNNSLFVNAAKPEVKAHAYVIMDAKTGNVLYSYQAKKRIYPASTTKVMTAMIALDHMKITKKLKYSREMKNQMLYYNRQQQAEIAGLGLSVGSSYTVKQYLYMMLLDSDANSAVALAMGTSGTVKKFSKLMNKKAKELGMKGTRYDNPIGLDRGVGSTGIYTTAYDSALMARHAMEYRTIRNIVAKKSFCVNSGLKVYNRNRLLSRLKNKKKKYKIIGLKTGTTKAAGHALISVAKDRKDHEIICAFFGNDSEERMYKDIETLLDYTFETKVK